MLVPTSWSDARPSVPKLATAACAGAAAAAGLRRRTLRPRGRVRPMTKTCSILPRARPTRAFSIHAESRAVPTPPLALARAGAALPNGMGLSWES